MSVRTAVTVAVLVTGAVLGSTGIAAAQPIPIPVDFDSLYIGTDPVDLFHAFNQNDLTDPLT